MYDLKILSFALHILSSRFVLDSMSLVQRDYAAASAIVPSVESSATHVSHVPLLSSTLNIHIFGPLPSSPRGGSGKAKPYDPKLLVSS